MRAAPSSVLALLALGALAACSRAQPSAPARPALVGAPIPLGEQAGEAYPGAVRAEVETELSFRVPGKIAKRDVDAGAQVTAGQVLASLDPEDARLNLEAARADHALALADAKRYRDLKGRGYASQAQVDSAVSKLKLAAAKLALAENQSAYTALKADADGVITAVLAEAGETVSAGRPVFRFAAGGSREVLINVPEGRIEALRKAESVGVSLWMQPGKLYQGRLRVVSPAADPQTRTHEVRVAIVDADAGVQLGATATVLIGAKGAAQTFKLPATALGDDGHAHARVWIVRGDPPSAQPVAVDVQQFLHESVIVRGDLKPSDRVITAGVHLLTPGMSVTPVARNAPAAL